MNKHVFPCLVGSALSKITVTDVENRGLTKRELFAAMAMQGLVANTDVINNSHMRKDMDLADTTAENALALADTLIEALEEEKK